MDKTDLMHVRYGQNGVPLLAPLRVPAQRNDAAAAVVAHPPLRWWRLQKLIDTSPIIMYSITIMPIIMYIVHIMPIITHIIMPLIMHIIWLFIHIMHIIMPIIMPIIMTIIMHIIHIMHIIMHINNAYYSYVSITIIITIGTTGHLPSRTSTLGALGPRDHR